MSKSNTSGRIYGGLSKDERTAQRRQKFIDAGIQLFGTQGYHATTVRKLCREAGLTDRYYYESFTSLEELLIASFDQCMLRIRDHITRAMFSASAGDGPHDVIINVLDAFFAEMEDKRIARLITLEVLGVSEHVDQQSNKRMLKLSDLILNLGRSLHPDWKIDDDEGALLGMSLLGAMRQATIHWVVSDYEMDRSRVVETTSLLAFGLLKSIDAQSRSTRQ